MKEKQIEYDLATRRAALHPHTSLDDKVVRQIRAAAQGETLYQYEKRLKEMGAEF